MLPGQTNSKRANILVVDDAPENLKLLLNTLTEQGYWVRCAKSGALAIAGSQAMPPDLVLLDIMMPHMDGYEVCQKFKQSASTRDIPIIFLSALDDGLDKSKAFEPGGDDYIAKPFNINEVLARIKHQLELKQQQQRLQQLATQYRQANQELRDTCTFFQEVLDSQTDSIAAFQSVRDDQGQITYFEQKVMNAAFGQLLGAQTEDFRGDRDHLKLIAPEADYNLFELCVQVVEGHSPLKREMQCRQGDAQQWLEVVATRLRDGVVTRLRNISDVKQRMVTLELAKRELHALATTDQLTHIANRYCFDLYLQREWQRSLRDQQPLSLLLGDIDKFKRYNDLCGHSVGDRCLQAVAHAIHGTIKRPMDLVARYGGEEFAILLPNTPLEGAVKLASRVQTAVRGLRLTDTQCAECEQVRISLGVAAVIPQIQSGSQELVEAADQALYQAKTWGGNTTCVETEFQRDSPQSCHNTTKQ